MKNLELQKLIDSWKKLTNGSTNWRIFSAAVTVGLATALVKVASIVKELVVAWRFGTGDALDAFLIALLVPSFIINVIAGSFNSALIPTYIQVREQEGIQAAQRLFSGATIWSVGLLGITTVLIVVTAPLYLPLIAAGFSPEKLELTFHLLSIIAPVILLSGIIYIWAAILNAGERFALAAVSPIITPAITIAFLFLINSWDIFALAVGLVCGAVLELAVLGVALHRQGISLFPRWYGFDSHLRQVASQYAPAMAGAFLICSAGLVDQSMAAMLSPGSVAALNYGNKFILFLTTINATALGTAVIPYFSKMAACDNWTGMLYTLKRYIGLIFLITIPLTGLIVIFSEPLVQVLFQRGSFTANDTHLVSQIQVFFALQTPFYIAVSILVNLLRAMQLNHILMWISGLSFLLNVILNYVFMQWLDIKGIALSTSCVYLFSFLSILFYATKHLKKVNNSILSKVK